MSKPTPQQVKAGQAVYNRLFLSVYDLFILGFLCRFIWKCPSHHLLELYNQHVSANHLDVGVGTGYFLDHCKFPNGTPRLALIDLNPNALDVSGKRLARYSPEIYCRDVFEPIEIGNQRFDSVGINGLLHCLPGTIRTKGIVFERLKPLLNPGGVLFGCTLLNRGVKKSRAAQRIMNRLNAQKIFTNLEDDLKDLKEELSKRFQYSSVNVIGCMALFWARK